MTARTDLLISISVYGAVAIGGAFLVSIGRYFWLLALPGAFFHLLLVDMLRADDVEPVDTWRSYLLDHGMALTFVAGPCVALFLLAGVLR